LETVVYQGCGLGAPQLGAIGRHRCGIVWQAAEKTDQFRLLASSATC
jgi:hypothetical protein